MDVWLTETYFDWLRSDCFSEPRDRRDYDGCLRLLHDIPFVWTIWADENRAGDALAFRQNDFLGYQLHLDRLDQQWLNQWASASASVLEVLLGIARRWNMYFEEPVPYYFGHLFGNLSLDRYPGRLLNSRSKTEIRERVDIWMFRQFEANGVGSPFPLSTPHQNVNMQTGVATQLDMREIDIWSQMNAYSAEHFQ